VAFPFHLEGRLTSRIRIRRIPCLPDTLQYRMLSGDSFLSRIFFLQLLLAVALDRRPTSRRVPPFNHLNSPYTLTSHKGSCMSHVISMFRPGYQTQTVVSELSKIIVCLTAQRFEHSTLVLRFIIK
jgi:hypothetical protein